MCSVLWLICLWDCCVLDNIRQKKNKASCYPKYEQTLDFVYAYTRQDSDIVAWNVWTYNKVTVCVQAEPEYKRENVPPPEVHVSCVLTPISIGIWVRENNKQAKPKHKILWDLVQNCVMCCSVSWMQQLMSEASVPLLTMTDSPQKRQTLLVAIYHGFIYSKANWSRRLNIASWSSRFSCCSASKCCDTDIFAVFACCG